MKKIVCAVAFSFLIGCFDTTTVQQNPIVADNWERRIDTSFSGWTLTCLQNDKIKCEVDNFSAHIVIIGEGNEEFCESLFFVNGGLKVTSYLPKNNKPLCYIEKSSNGRDSVRGNLKWSTK